jgi:hypothetical protein
MNILIVVLLPGITGNSEASAWMLMLDGFLLGWSLIT